MEKAAQILIEENKKKYGKVFSVPLNHKIECIFRPLTIGEYEKIENILELSSAELEDLVVKTCVFWPENFQADDFPAGIVTSLSDEILDSSNLSDINKAETILIEARRKSNTVTSIMKSTILALYDIFNRNLEDLDNLTFEQLCELVTTAEQIIKIRKTIYDPSVELEISFGTIEEEAVPTEDPTALKLQQALYGG
jgi:hypothetical protein